MKIKAPRLTRGKLQVEENRTDYQIDENHPLLYYANSCQQDRLLIAVKVHG